MNLLRSKQSRQRRRDGQLRRWQQSPSPPSQKLMRLKSRRQRRLRWLRQPTPQAGARRLQRHLQQQQQQRRQRRKQRRRPLRLPRQLRRLRQPMLQTGALDQKQRRRRLRQQQQRRQRQLQQRRQRQLQQRQLQQRQLQQRRQRQRPATQGRLGTLLLARPVSGARWATPFARRASARRARRRLQHRPAELAAMTLMVSLVLGLRSPWTALRH